MELMNYSENVKNKVCCHCHQNKELSEFGLERSKGDGHKGFCRSCASIYRRQHYNSKKAIANTTKWRDANPLKARSYSHQYRIKLKETVIAGYGGKCTCCGETEIAFLTLEHLNGDGARHRKECGSSHGTYRDVIDRGFPKEYTILCMNCNYAERKGDKCPHKLKALIAKGEA